MKEKFESSFGAESERPLEHVRRFFEMTKGEEESLRENINKHNGLVRLFVHPDFEEYAGLGAIKTEDIDVKKLKKEESAFQRILSSQSKDLPPLFILESGSNPEAFKESEMRLDSIAKNDIYVIRTALTNPSPLSPDREKIYKWRLFESVPDKEKEQMWEWVIAEFKQLGIKKILIGGLELYIAEEKGMEPGGCLGAAIHELKDSFEIELSGLTWPDSRTKTKR